MLQGCLQTFIINNFLSPIRKVAAPKVGETGRWVQRVPVHPCRNQWFCRKQCQGNWPTARGSVWTSLKIKNFPENPVTGPSTPYFCKLYPSRSSARSSVMIRKKIHSCFPEKGNHLKIYQNILFFLARSALSKHYFTEAQLARVSSEPNLPIELQPPLAILSQLSLENSEKYWWGTRSRGTGSPRADG